ncbi:hypothetical protein KFE98_04345 [bacterium SCSIO 12741]|nr:hypothetical protein KFE98_04345 [bacterium SCSIO 12741]
MKKRYLLLLALATLLVLPRFSVAQEAADSTKKKSQLLQNMQFNGYVKYLNTLFVPPTSSGQWQGDNLLHNRLNYKWFINNSLTFETAMRNRFFWGELHKANYTLVPDYYQLMDSDPSFFDLTWIWASDTSYMMHSTFDRLNLFYSYKNWEVILGRQRINWGTGLVWNPNDVFNAYSFFDFDYEERPGTDAALIRYFTGPSSSMEVVYALSDSIESSSVAGLYKFNKKGYDLQFFAGWQRSYWISGLGWSGEIKGAGFRGEATYFYPAYQYLSFNPQLVASVDLDYTFKNSLYIHGAYLYNSEGLDAKSGDYQAFFLNRELSAQTLSPAMHNVFGEVSYQLMPMLRGSIFSILNPSDGSLFFGPMVSYTVADNFEILLNGQIFAGDQNTAYGGYGSIYYLRFKLNF